MKRVLVLGSPGAGKSTFARALGQRTGLPVVHLDQLYWQPGWVEPDRQAFYAKMDRALAEPEWIMDGNFRTTLAHRLTFADTVIYLEMGRWHCLWNIVCRTWTSYGRVRPDMAEGCPERIDRAFLWFVWDFPKKYRPELNAALARFDGTLVSLSGRRGAKDYLTGL